MKKPRKKTNVKSKNVATKPKKNARSTTKRNARKSKTPKRHTRKSKTTPSRARQSTRRNAAKNRLAKRPRRAGFFLRHRTTRQRVIDSKLEPEETLYYRLTKGKRYYRGPALASKVLETVNKARKKRKRGKIINEVVRLRVRYRDSHGILRHRWDLYAGGENDLEKVNGLIQSAMTKDVEYKQYEKYKDANNRTRSRVKKVYSLDTGFTVDAVTYEATTKSIKRKTRKR